MAMDTLLTLDLARLHLDEIREEIDRRYLLDSRPWPRRPRRVPSWRRAIGLGLLRAGAALVGAVAADAPRTVARRLAEQVSDPAPTGWPLDPGPWSGPFRPFPPMQ